MWMPVERVENLACRGMSNLKGLFSKAIYAQAGVLELIVLAGFVAGLWRTLRRVLRQWMAAVRWLQMLELQ